MNPELCYMQNNCSNFTEADNGNCAIEFGDILECWAELADNEVNRCKKPNKQRKEVDISLSILNSKWERILEKEIEEDLVKESK